MRNIALQYIEVKRIYAWINQTVIRSFKGLDLCVT